MSEELKAAQARIACLEGEIAKRDAELAACRVAVENCEVFRARIAELEDDLKCAHSMLCEVSKSGMVLRAELAALKAQGNYAPASVVWIDAHHVIEGNNPSFIKDVALVSAERTSETQIPLVRLNAAPAQQVSVPDVSAMARILADRNADACNVNREDNWMIYGQDYIDDVTAMLAAAPAAPAADAGLVAVEWAKDAEGWGPALNEAGWLFLSELNEDPQKSALIFNNTKGPLRAAIMKYAEIVTAHRAKGVV